MSPIRSVFICAVILLLAAGMPAAEEMYLPTCSLGIPVFCVDASYFKRGDRYWVEVYFSVSNRALQFVKSKRGEYQASADLSVILFEKGSSQVAGDTQRLRLRASRYEETTAIDSVRTGVMAFPADAGDFSLGVALADRDTNMRSGVDAKFHIPEITDLPSLSDIRFEEPGTRGRSRVYPNVKRLFKGEFATIPFYFEAYAGEEHLPLTVEYLVLTPREEIVFRDTVTVSKAGRAGVEADIPAEAISNGFFSLVVGIPGEGGDFEVERAKVFEVRSQFFYWGKDVESAIDLLTYVAGGSFLNALREAGPEERKAMWDEFWREKDPTPDTPENEFYDEHVRRFEFANERFRTSYTPGWETDRGRIYITYGRPDRIESYPYDADQDATEIWHYSGLGRRFVFVDRTGFGDYRLTEEY
jgi:GWxTD domain-containing protein